MNKSPPYKQRVQGLQYLARLLVPLVSPFIHPFISLNNYSCPIVSRTPLYMSYFTEQLRPSSVTFPVFSLSYPQIQHRPLYLILRMSFILFKANLSPYTLHFIHPLQLSLGSCSNSSLLLAFLLVY